jgi:hypothetical protein
MLPYSTSRNMPHPVGFADHPPRRRGGIKVQPPSALEIIRELTKIAGKGDLGRIDDNADHQWTDAHGCCRA